MDHRATFDWAATDPIKTLTDTRWGTIVKKKEAEISISLLWKEVCFLSCRQETVVNSSYMFGNGEGPSWKQLKKFDRFLQKKRPTLGVSFSASSATATALFSVLCCSHQYCKQKQRILSLRPSLSLLPLFWGDVSYSSLLLSSLSFPVFSFNGYCKNHIWSTPFNSIVVMDLIQCSDMRIIC